MVQVLKVEEHEKVLDLSRSIGTSWIIGARLENARKNRQGKRSIYSFSEQDQPSVPNPRFILPILEENPKTEDSLDKSVLPIGISTDLGSSSTDIPSG
jgi:hypothetical protein